MKANCYQQQQQQQQRSAVFLSFLSSFWCVCIKHTHPQNHTLQSTETSYLPLFSSHRDMSNTTTDWLNTTTELLFLLLHLPTYLLTARLLD